jgi:hypothetical protein
MALTREQILATKPPMEQAQWLNGDVVNVAAMTGTARDSFEKDTVQLSSAEDEYGHMTNFRARLLVRCLVDDNGERLFGDDDAAVLGAIWCSPLDKAFDVAKRLNGFSPEDIKELEKNSDSAPSDCSGTT